MNTSFFKKAMVGTAALATVFTLAACGSKGANSSSSSSTNESSSTSSKKTVTAADKVAAAEKLIKQGKYQAALDEVNNVAKSTSESRALAADLQNYIAAKKAYDNGNYDQALTNLNTRTFGLRLRRLNQALLQRAPRNLPHHRLVHQVLLRLLPVVQLQTQRWPKVPVKM